MEPVSAVAAAVHPAMCLRPATLKLQSSLALLALIVGCSPDPAPGAPGPATLVRVPLGPDQGQAAPRDLSLVHGFPVDTGSVTLMRGRAVDRFTPEGEPLLRVVGKGSRSIQIHRGVDDGLLDARRFNQVVVRGYFPGIYFPKVRLTGGEGEELVIKGTATVNSEAEQVLLFELPLSRSAPPPWQRLVVVVEGKRSFGLTGVDLIWRPPASNLPPPEAPDLVRMDTDSRRAMGLYSGHPLVGRVQAQAGDELVIEWAQLAEWKRVSHGAELRLELQGSASGADPGLTRSWLHEASSSEWGEQRIALDPWAGKELSLRVSVQQDDERPELFAVSEPYVLRGSDPARTVLVVTSDTHRADHIHAARPEDALETPVLDALAARGVLFEDCWSSTNVTSPSHASIMTGIHPRDTRLVSNMSRMGDDARTLAEAFREEGYLTLGVVSVRHLGPAGTHVGQGLDRMLAPNGPSWDAEVAVEQLTEWIDEARGVPVFLWLHMFDAHHPSEPPGSFDRKYYARGKDPDSSDLPDLPPSVRMALPEGFETLRDLEFPVAQYAAEVSYLDAQLEPLLTHPRVLAGVTAVTADHGEVLVGAEHWFNHGPLLPATLHVPLIIAAPGLEPGSRATRPVMNLDVGRTVLDLAGERGTAFPGRNLFEPDPDEGGPRYTLSAHGSAASITLGPWHLVLYLRSVREREDTRRERHTVRLFHLGRDPLCGQDLAQDERDTARRLRQLLVDWLGAATGSGFSSRAAQDAASLAELAALGYSTGEAELQDEPWFESDGCPECLPYDQ